ncbi:hypothetical protein ABZX51_005385 [Aspergillus tubingensis]
MSFLPRLHLFEIADQPWCPHKAIEYAQLCLTHCWNLRLPPVAKAPSAEIACEVLADNFPDLSSFTFVDLGSGAGGPSATFERLLNARLRAQHLPPAHFLLTDLNPHPREWAALTKQQENISYISEPVDASKCGRLVPQNRKECRMFNVAFHHFDDPLAIPMLRSAIESADAFMYVTKAKPIARSRISSNTNKNNQYLRTYRARSQLDANITRPDTDRMPIHPAAILAVALTFAFHICVASGTSADGF